jgi:hypothetical protein
MNYRMFSDKALAHFRAFASQDERDRARGGRSSEGAHDISGRELKAALARESFTLARDEANEAQLDTATLMRVFEVVGKAYGPDTLATLKECIEEAFPGATGAADPEAPDTVAVDDNDDFSIAGQFKNAAKDSPPAFPGMPRPGGAMAKDAAIRLRRVERYLSNADDFAETFPMTKRIGLV